MNAGTPAKGPQQPLFARMSQDFFHNVQTDRCAKSGTDATACHQKQANDLFLLQEQTLLSDGSDKTERINRLHEQVVA